MVSTDRHTYEWLAVVILAGGLVGFMWGTGRLRVRPAAAPGPQEADWYFLLRVPEVPPGRRETRRFRKQFDRWLEALEKDGFHPMSYGDVHRRIARNQGLPENAVVLLFYPGYRHTVEALNPVLSRRRWPALLVTDAGAIQKVDLRYLSRLRMRVLHYLGPWDFAFYHGAPDAVTLQNPRDLPAAAKGPPNFRWSADAGWRASNQLGSPRRLSYLSLNPSWTPGDLVSRLLAEVPVRRPSAVTLRSIQQKQWGIILPGADTPEAFTVQATRDQRSGTVAWRGAAGLEDVQVDLEVASLTGELWLWLRSDRTPEQNVRIGFADGEVRVFEERQGSDSELSAVPVSPQLLSQPFQARVALNGPHLTVAMNGREILQVGDLPPIPSSRGCVELTVYDKVRGAAAATISLMKIVPLKPQELADARPAFASYP